MSRRKEAFVPSLDNAVRMFVCGPTVYDYLHLGHARTYLAFDTIARYLRYTGYNVAYIMNVTDVAERIVDKAEKLKKNPLELANQYEADFLEDMRSLKITGIQGYKRASEYIPQIIAQVAGLLQRGVAYETNTGVYFEIDKYPKFGQLSGLSKEELSLKRFELCSSKKNPEDFSLWRKHEKRSFGWDSPWGHGRPGWHIEDTAISMNIFGDTYDIHGGASELIFPHHEAEIAQAEALSGKSPFVRFWLHTGLLNVKGRKMSKSLGNVIRIRDTLREHSAEELRYYVAGFHYRQPVTISDAGLNRARRGLRLLEKNFASFTKSPSTGANSGSKLTLVIQKGEEAFRRHMDNDFDTPRALKALMTLSENLSRIAKHRLKVDDLSKQNAEATFRKMADVFGFLADSTS